MKLKKIKVISKNKKGGILDLFLWIILSFIIILFFAGWIYGFNLVTEQLTSIEAEVLGNNISDIAQDTFGKINPVQTRSLHILAFVMIFIMGISMLITNFMIKSHPVFFVLHLFVIIVAIIVSVYISNEYEELLTNRALGATLSEFTGATYIMLFLPLWTTIFGIGSSILLFSGILRDSGAGGSVM